MQRTIPLKSFSVRSPKQNYCFDSLIIDFLNLDVLMIRLSTVWYFIDFVHFPGYRMPAPEGTPDACYDLMMKCWEYNPAERYHFDKIHKELQSILKSLW